MRCFGLLLTTLLIWNLEVLSQSSWISIPPPTTHDLRKLSFLDSLNGWVSGDSGTILRTTNGGVSWTQQNPGVDDNISYIFMLNEQHGWALAQRYYYDTVHHYLTVLLSTSNGGEAWQTQFLEGDLYTGVSFRDSLVGWMGSVFGKIVKTTNGGSTWEEKVIEPGVFSHFPMLNIKFFSPTYGYAMGGRMDIAGVVWRTTNAGENWTASGVAPEPVLDLYFFDSLNIFGVTGDLDWGAGMVSTTNAGTNWDYRFLEIWGEGRALAVRTHSEMWSPLGFAGTYMYSLDSGTTWISEYTPDTTAMYDGVFTDDRIGYMVGAEGTVLKYDFMTDVQEKAQDVPSRTMLHQNYPNPFNPSTTIRFTIHDSRFTSLKVYNLLGQEVAALVNEVKHPGHYQVRFNAGGLPGGVYFYRLHSGTITQTRKLLLLK